jgi:hypothetical protein
LEKEFASSRFYSGSTVTETRSKRSKHNLHSIKTQDGTTNNFIVKDHFCLNQILDGWDSSAVVGHLADYLLLLDGLNVNIFGGV